LTRSFNEREFRCDTEYIEDGVVFSLLLPVISL
jgi:hypothetical protein